MHSKDPKRCEMCERSRKLTFHHLIPRKCHTNKWFKKHFDKDDMKTRGLYLCSLCHNYIHEILSEKELGRNFNTLELLLGHEKIRRFVKYSKKLK